METKEAWKEAIRSRSKLMTNIDQYVSCIDEELFDWWRMEMERERA